MALGPDQSSGRPLMKWIRRQVKRSVLRLPSVGLQLAMIMLRTSLVAAGAMILLAANVAAQNNHTPSSHCHVSDGAFTTCPDGSSEWSDVPFQSFPASNSFLYADQANLDPTLS